MSMHRFVVLLLLILGTALRGQCQEARQQALEHTRAGEPPLAEARYREALRQDPESGPAGAGLSLTLLELGRYEEALEVARDAVEHSPEGSLVQATLAIIYAARYQYTEAEQVLEQALTQSPDDWRLLTAKGRTLWLQRKTRTAVEALNDAAGHPDASAEPSYWLGTIYAFKAVLAEGAYPGWHNQAAYRARAEQAYRNAIAKDSEGYKPYVGLGKLYLEAGEPARALASFDRALEIAPNLASARSGRWKALAEADEIRQEVESLLARRRDDPEALAAAKVGYGLMDEGERKLQIESRLLTEFPVSPASESVRVERIEAAARTQSNELAELARNFIVDFPYSRHLPSVYTSLLNHYASVPGVDPLTLLHRVERSILVDPNADAYRTGARALIERRLFLDRAIRLAEMGAEKSDSFVRENEDAYKMEGKIQSRLDRNRATHLNLIGWALFRKGDVPGAEQKLLEARSLSAGLDRTNQILLGELYASKGMWSEAHECYLNALALASRGSTSAVESALREAYEKSGGAPDQFDSFLESRLAGRKVARREQLLAEPMNVAAPGFRLEDLEGKTFELTRAQGKVIMLTFWASW